METREDWIRALAPLWKKAGFRKRRASWNRQQGQLVEVVAAWTSKSFDSFDLEFGIYDPEMHELCWPGLRRSFIPIPSCMVRTNLTREMGVRCSWGLEDLPSPEAAVPRGLAFFDRMRTEGAMEEWLEEELRDWRRGSTYPPPVVHLALLKFRRGDRSSAIQLLDRLNDSISGPWEDRMEEIYSHFAEPGL